MSFWQFKKQTEFELQKPLMELRVKMYSDILTESAKLLPAISKPIDVKALKSSNLKLKNMYYESFTVLGDPRVHEVYVQLTIAVDNIVAQIESDNQSNSLKELSVEQSLSISSGRYSLSKCISSTLKDVLNVQLEEKFMPINTLKNHSIYCRVPDSDQYRNIPNY